MKKILVILLTLALVGCSNQTDDKKNEENNASNEQIKVAIVLSTGGLGDKNFNDMSYAGLERAKEELNIEFDYIESQSATDYEPAYRQFADSGEYDLIIGLASDQIDALKAVSLDYPEQKFSLIDATLELTNVSSISTKWSEQTFLSGVYAGLGTLSDMEYANDDNVVGVILGADFPNLQEGTVGFEAGVRYVNPDATVLTSVVGDFSDANKAKEMAVSMYTQGADFIQHLAGASGLGVFAAANENNKYVFGVGSNQNYLYPDNIVATSIRNVDDMVYNQVKQIVDGTRVEGLIIEGLKEGAVGYSAEQSNIVAPENIVNAISDIETKIKNGELVPCGNREELEEWLANNQYN